VLSKLQGQCIQCIGIPILRAVWSSVSSFGFTNRPAHTKPKHAVEMVKLKEKRGEFNKPKNGKNGACAACKLRVISSAERADYLGFAAC
jgi:hypothetical protein